MAASRKRAEAELFGGLLSPPARTAAPIRRELRLARTRRFRPYTHHRCLWAAISERARGQQPRCPGRLEASTAATTPAMTCRSSICPGSSPISLLVEQSELLDRLTPCWSPPKLQTNEPSPPPLLQLLEPSRGWRQRCSALPPPARCLEAVSGWKNASSAALPCCWRRSGTRLRPAEASSTQVVTPVSINLVRPAFDKLFPPISKQQTPAFPRTLY